MRNEPIHLIRCINHKNIISRNWNLKEIQMICGMNTESVSILWACNRKRRRAEIGIIGTKTNLKKVTCPICKRSKWYKIIKERKKPTTTESNKEDEPPFRSLYGIKKESV